MEGKTKDKPSDRTPNQTTDTFELLAVATQALIQKIDLLRKAGLIVKPARQVWEENAHAGSKRSERVF